MHQAERWRLFKKNFKNQNGTQAFDRVSFGFILLSLHAKLDLSPYWRWLLLLSKAQNGGMTTKTIESNKSSFLAMFGSIEPDRPKQLDRYSIL